MIPFMLIIIILVSLVGAFSPDSSSSTLRRHSSRRASSSIIVLFSTPRKPRRMLKKRRNRRREAQEKLRKGTSSLEGDDDDISWAQSEIRPLISSKSREAGEDYWIDPKDLKRSIERQQAIKNRKAMEGEIPKEKLWTEVFAPYKQNWIGIFSMIIVILATIVTKFPELLNSPVIPIPDL